MKTQEKIIETFISELDPQLVASHSVGALLYSPATNQFIYGKLRDHSFGEKFSLALCLEDSIDDSAVAMGELNIVNLFSKIKENFADFTYLPKLFIRVRCPEQMIRLCALLSNELDLLCGFILPKFSLDNASQYLQNIVQINQASDHKIYILPILESNDIIPLHTRISLLTSIYDLLIEYKPYVLNIRVGGNDLCHTFGIRRNIRQSIYDILPIAAILSDIITTFHHDFVISGPVWEYFSGADKEWKAGLEKEIELDLINGFIGKTVIHPEQIAVVNDRLKVAPHDLEDALRILSFDHSIRQVAKSSEGTRMNEVKTHTNWARRQLLMAYIYGAR